MKPSWKTYDIESWEHGIAGCSPRPGRPTDRFVFNDCGVCINPHVLGVAAKGWRIGIYTARNKRGRWVAGADFSFSTVGYGSRPWNSDPNHFPEEWGAQSAMLRKAAGFIERNSTRSVSCPIPGTTAREALRLISQAIEDIEPKRFPTYTQLSLF